MTDDAAQQEEQAPVTATVGDSLPPCKLCPSNGMHPLPFTSPNMNSSVTINAPDNDNDEDNTITNFEVFSKKDSHM
jgi:hypothetical protein